jgi:beta-lactamase superfamily II metal-dependent hydrolase
MKRFLLFCLFVILTGMMNVSFAQQQKSARSTLNIYYVDVEGGAATLIVTPAGESILVDAGWPGFDGRDAKRIEKAMKVAGVTSIDHLITTHYHTDHYGGTPELAKLVKVRKFYDHGPVSSLPEDKEFATKYAAYQAAAGHRSIALQPGSTIKLRRATGTPAISLQCLAAGAMVLPGTVTNGASNTECLNATLKPDDPSDNARSVVFLLRYGSFDFLNTGDLTWNIEHGLVCPQNLIGEIDLYQVGHHGANNSNNPVLLRSIKPMVAIMNNGPRKGGHPDTVKWLREVSSLKDLWQVHRNVMSTPEQNAPEEFIANLDEKNDAAHLIHVSVDPVKGSYTVFNNRNGKSTSYQIK